MAQISLVSTSSPRGQKEAHQKIGGATWGSLFNFCKRAHVPVLAPALFLSVACGILVPALAIFLGKIFNSFTAFGAGKLSGHELKAKVSTQALGVLGLAGANWLLKGLFFTAWLMLGELQAKEVRDKIFANLLQKDFEWFEIQVSGIGALLPRLQTQICELQTAVSQPLGFVIEYLVTVIAALGLALYTSWNLTLVTLAGVPLSAMIVSLMSSKMQQRIAVQEQELKKASKLATGVISFIDTVKCFNAQEIEARQYHAALSDAGISYLKQAKINASQIGFLRFITLVMFFQGFWYGSHLVSTGKSSAGNVLTTFWACLMATKAAEDILPFAIVLEKGRAAGANLQAILLEVDRGKRLSRGRAISDEPRYCEGDIEMRNISFKYPSRPQNLVLEKSTFFFPAGETTFVVGKSGSGKSTIGNLLMRFYKPLHGEIFIDGHALASLSISWIRNNITLVQQHSILFNETIFRNIAFGRLGYPQMRKEDVQECIDLAMLQETITEMPQGLETVVGAGGNALSGGQKQRIAIARARLRDTPVLILDESTSALDYTSRLAVMEAIRDWRKGRTTIVITHDMSHIKDSDFLYVLENGHVTKEGYRHKLKLRDEDLSALVSSPGAPARAFSNEEARHEALSSLEKKLGPAFGPGPDPETQPLNSILDVQPPVLSATSSRKLPMSMLSPLSQSTGRRSTTSMEQSTLSTRDVKIDGQGTPHSPRLSFLSPLTTRRAVLQSSSGGIPKDRPLSSTVYQTRTARVVNNSQIRKPQRASFRPVRLNISQREETQQVFSVKQILLTVWPTLNSSRRITLVVGFGCALTHAACPPLFSWVFAQLLQTFYQTNNASGNALKWSMAILGIAVGDGVASFFMHYMLERCGQSWVDKLREEAMTRIVNQPKEWFEKDQNGLSRLTSCLDHNAEEMRNLLGRFAAFVFVAASMMLAAIVWSLVVCWEVTLVSLSVGPVMYLLTKTFQAVSSKWETRTNEASEAAAVVFTETFTDIKTVRSLTIESYFHKKFEKATSRAIVVGFKRAVYTGFFYGGSDSMIFVITALIFWFGSTVAASMRFSVKDVLTVFSMLLFSTANAIAVIAYIPQISQSLDTATRLLRLSRMAHKASHEHIGTHHLVDVEDIRFHGLNFTYPSRPGHLVLKDFNLTIPANKCTALVGQSGSGKSTVTSILLGLYPPSERPISGPMITIGGHDIRQLHISSLRSLIAVVPQQPTLFSATIRQNITYGLDLNSRHTATENIRLAAQAAGIEEFVDSLPHGFETPVGEGGIGLSGGQAQRLVIARALCRQPQVLILDEATAALDQQNAEIVRQSIVRLIQSQKNMTVIIITHAKEMMELADNVVVLKQGRIVEVGGYGELLGQRGTLWKMNNAGGLES